MEKARILIVEDEAIIAMELENQLQSLGYEVTSVVNTGERAIQKAELDNPDLMLMDIRIKGEMDGIDTAEILRSRFGIPVIFSTAYADDERLNRAKLTQPFGYLLKPIQEMELKVTLEMALYAAKMDNERKQIAKNLQESEEKYKIAFKTSSDAVNINRLDGSYVDINAGFTRLTGFTKEDVIGKRSSEIQIWANPEDREKLVSGLKTTGNVENLESKFRCKDGSFKIALMSANIIELNKEPHILSITKDITDRKKIEEALIKSEEKYRELAQSSNSIILKLDQNYNFSFFNQFAQDFFGFSENEIIGRGLIGTIVPETESTGRNQKKMIKDIFDHPEAFTDNENENIRKNGERVWVAWRNIGIYDDSGKFSGMLCTGYDITERKQAETALKKEHNELEQKIEERTKSLQHEIDERKQIEYDLLESRKEAEFANNAKSEFLSNISHEFRTPMHQILSYSKFGVDKIDKVTKEKLLHYFEKIGAIGKNLLSLLNDLLDLSKLESGKFDYDIQSVDLKKIIGNISNEFQLLIDEKGLSLKLTESDIPTEINCDEYKVGQVIRNFLSNAVKFTPKGKEIKVSYEFSEFANGQRKTDTETIQAICIKVSDQGIGIPAAEIKDVFDKFVQSSKTNTGAGGTGLGLAICKEIIDAHSGKIWAENNPEGGSTFSFMLPYKQVHL